MMIQAPQVEPISNLRRDHVAVMSKLKKGPVFLAQRGSLTAALVSIEQWNALVSRLQHLELLAEARRIDATMDADPSQIVSHHELKQKLAEKKANVGA